jgi:hypothetical protein
MLVLKVVFYFIEVIKSNLFINIYLNQKKYETSISFL